MSELHHDPPPVDAARVSVSAASALVPVGPGGAASIEQVASGWGVPGCDREQSPVVAELVGRLSGVLEELGELSLTGLAETDVVELVDQLSAAMGRVTAQACRVVVEADARRIADRSGDRSTVTWWARRSRLTRGEAGRLLGLGQRLGLQVHGPVEAALAAGEIRVEQAQVITAAVDALPDQVAGRRLDPAVRARARDLLLVQAQSLDARALRILGRRVLDVVAPEVAESHEQRLLEAEEAAAAAAARFSMVDDGHGRCHGRFTLPSLHGSMLAAQLHALANPRRATNRAGRHDPAADGEGHDDSGAGMPGPVITPEVLGQALMAWVESYPTDRLPVAGGVAATVTVTMDLDALLSGIGVATLEDGMRISAGEARRLACQAGLVPMVLGTGSVPLDQGRQARLATTGQRRALIVRDGGCTAAGCGLPASVCHAHHDQPWATGGPTDLAKLRLLCPRHHRLAHDRRYETRHAPDHTITFHRRT